MLVSGMRTMVDSGVAAGGLCCMLRTPHAARQAAGDSESHPKAPTSHTGNRRLHCNVGGDGPRTRTTNQKEQMIFLIFFPHLPTFREGLILEVLSKTKPNIPSSSTPGEGDLRLL